MISRCFAERHRMKKKEVCKSAAIQITRKMIQPAELETRETQLKAGEIPIGVKLLKEIPCDV
jgi:hypothetical protein